MNHPDERITADLHIHSTYSDGEYSPVEAVKAAHALGYNQIAVTDHDTIDGVDEAINAGKALGVEVVPGIEVTLRFRRTEFTGSLHLLLYFSRDRFFSEDFRSKLQSIVRLGRGRNLVLTRVARINEEFGPRGNKPLLVEELSSSALFARGSNISRRHFARELKETHRLSDQLISDIIGNNSSAYVPSGVDMHAVSPLLEYDDVLGVLAHPAAGSYPGDSHYKEVLPPYSTVKQMLPEFLSLGIRGLEVHYPGHTSDHVGELLDLVKTHGLIATGGSDCHDETTRPMGSSGLTKPMVFPGFSNR